MTDTLATPTNIQRPGRLAMFCETRTAFDVVRMAGPLLRAQLRSHPRRDDLHIIVVPGFGADDRYTLPLRHFLRRRGFSVEGWGMGRNVAGLDLPHGVDKLSAGWDVESRDDYHGEAAVPYLCDQFAARVAERHAAVGRPIALIGWSLGGYVAREAARDLPNQVNRVITLGSPITGGPKYTAAAPFFERRGMDLDWIEAEVEKRAIRPIRQPITAIYSKSDAIVPWRAAIDVHHENANHVEVSGAHLGLAFNPTVWSHIVTALAEAPDAALDER